MNLIVGTIFVIVEAGYFEFNPMKYIPFLLLISILTFCSFNIINQSSATSSKWVLLKGGSLQVKGSTNVNKFSCDITGYNRPDTLNLFATDKNINLRGKISLDVNLFDCHHPVMTADLRKTLKTKEFPKLNINFLTLDRLPNLTAQASSIKGLVDIELAGKTKRYEVAYKLSSPTTKTINLIGEKEVNFTDFGLTPPRKIGGMIQTNNELFVTFKLTMKVVQ